MAETILDKLSQGVVLGDGGYLLALESRGYVQAGPFAPEVTIEQLTRYEMGDFARRALDLGVNYIGGCCGCQGAHIRQMARALDKMPTEEREWAIDYETPQSATEAYHHMRQE